MDKNDIVIVGAARTRFGRYSGSLKDLNYFDLGAIPMSEVLKRVDLNPNAVDEVFWGVGDTFVCKDVRRSNGNVRETPAAELIFQDCLGSKEKLLEKEGEGIRNVCKLWIKPVLRMPELAVGIAQSCLDYKLKL